MRLPTSKLRRWKPTAFAKTILRSIRGSLGRFLAIVGIVALGCGFYAGLQMCGPDMRAAADELYDGTRLYDLRIVSTLGFTENDVKRVRGYPGVDGAMAAISCDVMAHMRKDQLAVRISSLDVDAAGAEEEKSANVILSDDGSYLNRVFLREGRWPKEPDECVITADKPVADLQIGDKIDVLYGATDLKDMLVGRTFEVVGTVSSPTYPYTGSFGSTTLGSGMIGEYVYVAPAAFVEDAPFTEIYVHVSGADELESGSDEYVETVDAVRKRLEGKSDELAQARRDDIVADAQKSVDDGREELDQRRSEANAELDAAKADLDAAQKELADGQEAFDEGAAEYERGRTTAQQELASAQATIDANRAELALGRSELEAGEAAAYAGEQELLAGMMEVGVWAPNLAVAKLELGAMRGGLYAALGTLDAAEAAQDEVDRLKQTLERYEGLAATISNAVNEMSAATSEARLATLNDRLTEARASAEELQRAADMQGAPEYTSFLASGAWNVVYAIEDQIAQVNQAIESARINQEMGEQTRVEYEAAKARLEELAAQAAEYPAREEIQARLAQIADAMAGVDQLEAAQAQLRQARKQIEAGEKQLDSAQAELDSKRASAEAQLAEGKSQLDASRDKLDEGRRKYEEGLAEYERGRAEADERFADAKRQLDDAQAKIDEVEKPEVYLLDRSQSEGALAYDADSHRIDSIANVFPLMFFLVAALVALTTMTRMVDDERVEIGTYKALGYSTARIASKYLAYAGSASAVGAFLGILALSQLLPFVVTVSYSSIYTVPLHPFPLPVNLGIALVAGGLGVGVTLLATWGAVVATLREVPAALMLARAPVAGKRILLERVGFLWRRLSFSHKVTYRNLFRYKRRLCMTVIGIAGCTALILLAFGLHDAIWDIIDRQYGPIVHYDTTIRLADDATELDVTSVVDYLESSGSVDGIIRVQQENMQAGVGVDEEKIRVQVVVPRSADDITKLITFRDRVSGAAVPFDDESVFLTEKLALKYGLGVGDTILLFGQDSIGNAHGSGYGLVVSGIVENYVGNLVYVGRDAWRQVDEATPVFSAIYATTVDDEEVREELTEALLDRDDVSTVTYATETITVYRNMLQVVDVVVMLLVVSAGLLAFIVLYNLTNINIGERVREIASLKVLGFTPGEVYAYIFREIVLLAVMGSFLGMALGSLLAEFVITTAEVDYVMFGRMIHLPSYGWSFLLTMVFTALILMLMRKKLDRVNMVESLKSIE